MLATFSSRSNGIWHNSWETVETMTEHDARPLLAITIGDPAGIGPEITLGALAEAELFNRCRPLVVGDRRILERAASWLGLERLQFELITVPDKGEYQAGTIPLLDLANAPPDDCPPGQVTSVAGDAAVKYVFRACDLAMEGSVDGIVTGPINKASINAAGHHYAGHTELLAERTSADRVSMLLTSERLKVVHVSTHVGLAEAIQRVTPERVREVIGLADESCRALGIEHPRIAVAGLNPHASEGGLFGNQEAEQIQPAIDMARADGIDVSDPQPPDTVFLRAVQGYYDIVVAMYHDQGHIPMKLLAFDSGVNVSIGLPIIRTSVDHGTAFDIAGTGKASSSSMTEAITVAIQMAHARSSSD
jgi:4-phospho-D-threonate 3-dehydrogenase / 4-phospho-D-erythronate 3-dehydrogenase